MISYGAIVSIKGYDLNCEKYFDHNLPPFFFEAEENFNVNDENMAATIEIDQSYVKFFRVGN